MGIQLQQLDKSNIKMKLFFVLALFIASAFAGNSATTSFTGPAELVKHIAEFDDKSARACVSVKAPKAKQVEVKLTKAQFDDLLAKCKNNEPIDLSQFELTAPQLPFPPKPQPNSQKLSNQTSKSSHTQSSNANCDVTIV